MAPILPYGKAEGTNVRGISKDSHTIVKPRSAKPEFPPQRITPIIRVIHVFAPKVIKTDAANFRSLVQKLTGNHRSSTSKERKRGGGKGKEVAEVNFSHEARDSSEEFQQSVLKERFPDWPEFQSASLVKMQAMGEFPIFQDQCYGPLQQQFYENGFPYVKAELFDDGYLSNQGLPMVGFNSWNDLSSQSSPVDSTCSSLNSLSNRSVPVDSTNSWNSFSSQESPLDYTSSWNGLISNCSSFSELDIINGLLSSGPLPDMLQLPPLASPCHDQNASLSQPVQQQFQSFVLPFSYSSSGFETF